MNVSIRSVYSHSLTRLYVIIPGAFTVLWPLRRHAQPPHTVAGMWAIAQQGCRPASWQSQGGEESVTLSGNRSGIIPPSFHPLTHCGTISVSNRSHPAPVPLCPHGTVLYPGELPHRTFTLYFDNQKYKSYYPLIMRKITKMINGALERVKVKMYWNHCDKNRRNCMFGFPKYDCNLLFCMFASKTLFFPLYYTKFDRMSHKFHNIIIYMRASHMSSSPHWCIFFFHPPNFVNFNSIWPTLATGPAEFDLFSLSSQPSRGMQCGEKPVN